MNCLECGGACCETILVPLSGDADIDRWLVLHGIQLHERAAINCRCTALTDEGLCAIYDTRPEVCRRYEPGGPECLGTVRVRRTRKQYARIREEGDPLRIHGSHSKIG